jgi:hypothetical protein
MSTSILDQALGAALARLREYRTMIYESEKQPGGDVADGAVSDELAGIDGDIVLVERAIATIAQLQSKPWPPSQFHADPLPADTRPSAEDDYRKDVEYFRAICERTKLSTRQIAKSIGINDGELRGYLTGRRPWPYPVQFAIERLGG